MLACMHTWSGKSRFMVNGSDVPKSLKCVVLLSINGVSFLRLLVSKIHHRSSLIRNHWGHQQQCARSQPGKVKAENKLVGGVRVE